MSILEYLDPVTIFGLEAPKEVPRSAMREIERGRSHYNGVFRYFYMAGKILRENALTGKLTFYDLNGKRSFLS